MSRTASKAQIITTRLAGYPICVGSFVGEAVEVLVGESVGGLVGGDGAFVDESVGRVVGESIRGLVGGVGLFVGPDVAATV